MAHLVKSPQKIKKWNEKGVDIWLIRDNLKISFEKRILQHQDTINCIDELKQLGRTNRAKLGNTLCTKS